MKNMIDFQLLMIKLQNAKVTTRLIWQETGMGWQQQGRLRRGETQEPKFNVGVKLLDLALDELGEEGLRACMNTKSQFFKHGARI